MSKRLCIVLAFAASASALAAPRVSIELLPQAEVTTDDVRLGQVAHLNSPELALIRKLVDLPIGRVPRTTSGAVLQREALTRWLGRAAGLVDGDVQWRGSESTQVQRHVRWVRGEQIAAAAIDALQAQFTARGGEARLQVRFLPRDVEAPAGEVRLQPRAADQAAWRNRMVVWVDLWAEGGFVRTVPVTLDVDGSGSAGLLDGAAARAPTAQGTSGTGSRLPPALVARGEWATLRSAAGAVELESRVEVLQEGRLGQRVRARQSGATGLVFARVVGPALLELAP